MSVQPEPQKIRCPQCGESNMAGNDICWKCRFNLKTNTPAKKSASCWSWGCTIVGILIMLPMVIYAIGMLSSVKSTP